MTPNTMGKLLCTVNPTAMLPHSVVNYRIQGLDCLTLHHTPDLTIKLFLMEDTLHIPDTYLAPPHIYRKPYNLVILNGCIDHVHCKKLPGDDWTEFEYDPKRRQTTPVAKCSLEFQKYVCGYHGNLWCGTDIIHTMKVRPNKGPLVVGMTQLRTERLTNTFFLDARGMDPYPRPEQRRPTMQEMLDMIERAKFYVNRHFNVIDKANPEIHGNNITFRRLGEATQ